MTSITQRFDAVCERLARAAERSGRPAGSVRLVAISKMHGADRVAELARYWAGAAKAAGKALFGENYVQEAVTKQAALADLLPNVPVEWHFTGHIQSRKSRDVLGAFTLLHTLDSIKLAESLQKAWENRVTAHPDAAPQAVLAQVNIGREAQKSGVDPERLEDLLGAAAGMSGLRVIGLMCIPPFGEGERAARACFARLRELREKAGRACGLPLPHLSMGMSGDFEAAIEEGATLVRVGTDIFGERL
jgi:pyridoxal phosphate enzyme (YggS family)